MHLKKYVPFNAIIHIGVLKLVKIILDISFFNFLIFLI